MRIRDVGVIAAVVALLAAGCTGNGTPGRRTGDQSPTARITRHRAVVLHGDFDAPVIAFGSGSSGLVELVGSPGTSRARYTWFDRSATGGARWAAGRVTRKPRAASAQHGLAFTGEQFGWAFGPGLAFSEDTGRTWKLEPSAPPVVTALDTARSATWLLGAACQRCRPALYRTKGPDAQAYRVTHQPPVTGRLIGVARLSLTDGVVLARAPHGTTRLARTSTQGRTWQVFAGACPRGTTSSLADADGVLWLSCQQPSIDRCGCNGQLIVFRSPDSGATWRRMTPPAPGAAGALTGTVQLVPASATVAWARVTTSNTSRLERTVDGGRSWQVVLSSRWAGDVDMRSLAVLDVRTAWLVASGTRRGGQMFWVYRTTDGGQSWRNAVLPVPSGLPQ